MARVPWRIVMACAVLVALVSAAVSALTPETKETQTIAQLLAAAPGHRLVLLQGTVQSLAPNRLLLSDSSGEIRLNTCPVWYRPLAFGSRERVRVLGHLDSPRNWRLNHPVFVVYQIQGEYGTRVTLRHNDSVPLWHRYRDIPGRQLQWQINQELASANWPR